MRLPTRRRLPAVLLGVLGALVLVGSLAAAGWLALGAGSTEYGHAVTAVDPDLCDGAGYATTDYADLSRAGKRVIDEALAAGEGAVVTRAETVADFRYPRDPETRQVPQYVRRNGTCYELVTRGGDPAGAGTLLAGVLAIAVAVAGGLGGAATLGVAAVAYRAAPRLAPPALVLLAGLGAYAAVQWPPGVATVVLIAALSAPAFVWVGLTRRGWAGSARDDVTWLPPLRWVHRGAAGLFVLLAAGTVIGVGDAGAAVGIAALLGAARWLESGT